MVAFHQYTGIYAGAKLRGDVFENETPVQWIGRKYLTNKAAKYKRDPRQTQACCEYFWYGCKRPYYNVWPSVLRMLLETDLDIPCRYISLPLPTIALNLPQVPGLPFRTILATIYDDDAFENLEGGGSRWRPTGQSGEHKNRRLVVAVQIPGEEFEYFAVGGTYMDPAQEFSVYVKNEPDIIKPSTSLSDGHRRPPVKVESQTIIQAFKVVIGVSLLANDPAFVEPVVLNKDLLKYENATEEVKRRIEERARRVQHAAGHHIGRKVEDLLTGEEKDALHAGPGPHIRRPHLCTFWVGKGRETPRLQLRRGAVVQPRKLTEIPTGYLDDEKGTEGADTASEGAGNLQTPG